jgi:hypothetical protein
MEEDEPSELKNATGEKKALNGPADDEEDAVQLRKYYLEIKNDNLFDSNCLDPCLHELTPVGDNQRLFSLLFDSPFELVTEVALASKCKFS